MNHYRLSLILLLFAVTIVSCNQPVKTGKETILEGQLTILVDESLLPIVADQVEIFENRYSAKITLIPKTESEVIADLAKDTGRVAILSRNLRPDEQAIFKKRRIIPRITPFASDGIALITNIRDKDSIVRKDDLTNFLQGKPSVIKGLVFDNLNSGTARYLQDLAATKQFPNNGVYSFHTNSEAIRYVSENRGMIGVVGINWIVEPSKETEQYLPNVRVLQLRDSNGQISAPSQNDIAEGIYPLARHLFIVNCQGYSGLGMGFASFIAGETGQRIVLKSGLVPERTPSRNIRTRSTIEKNHSH